VVIEPKIFVPRGQFQTEGSNFILDHPRCQMNVDMGLGKTIMTYNALDLLFFLGEPGPVLVLAPLRVARNVWPNEVKKWVHLQHLKVVPIIGTAEERKAALRKDAQIYTINYENVQWLVDQHKGSWPYKIVVADESTKLKGCRSSIQVSSKGKKFIRADGGARTAALSKIAHTKVDRWINLTGTFAPNGLEQTWGQLWFLDGGKRLGNSFTAFKDRWFRVGFNGFGMEAMPFAEAQIREAISDITFTLDANDYLALCGEVVNNIYVDIPPKQMLQYRRMEKEFYTELEHNEIEAFTAATKSMKLHQMANGFAYVDKQGGWESVHDEKIDALQSVLEEAGGMPVICVYKFKTDLEKLLKAFPKGRVFDANPKTEKDFKNGEIPILFVQPQSAGHGIDGLQDVTNIIAFFSLDWDSELRCQVVGRIGQVRQFQSGHSRPVMIHNIIARGTIDEDILTRLQSRISVEMAMKAGMARRIKS
jgi:SNF2 family DNA or RNA helicase